MEINKRLCTECHEQMKPRLISMCYGEKQIPFSIEVVGIPASVCSKCNFRLIPAKIARYIDTIIDALFESFNQQQKEKLLPIPHITIWFPSRPEMANAA